MEYTKLGNTDLIISRLSFGTMTFGSHPYKAKVTRLSESKVQGPRSKVSEVPAF
jgi:aryl-alcohol dehydrogenase-like predicted oxidoreductase